MISAAVPCGANTPFHDTTSYPETPASATVGTSVKNGERSLPVATTGKERSPFFTDVPTVAEAGVSGYEVVSWNGVFAPHGTAAEIIELLNKTIREIVATPEVKQRYAELGIEAKASTPAELKDRLTRDIGKWAAVIERAGIPKQ